MQFPCAFPRPSARPAGRPCRHPESQQLYSESTLAAVRGVPLPASTG